MLLHPFILEIEELAVPDNDDAECSISSSSSSDQSLFESWNEDYSWDDNPLQLLQEQELDYCIDDVDYLLPSSSHKENVIVTPSNRRVMCNWCYKIAELSSVDNVVVCIAMSYLDRFMATSLSDHNNTSSTVARRALGCRHEYQLAVVTCLFIAMKLRGKWQFGADTIATDICSGMYTKEEIEIMELEILHALSWKLNGPTAHDFIIAMVNLLPRNNNSNNNNNNSSAALAAISTLVQLANDHIEAAILDYEMALQPSSRLAYVALLASLQRSDVTIDTYFDPTDLVTWTNTIDNNMWFKKVCIAVEQQGSTIVRPTIPVLLPHTSISLTSSDDDNDATTSDDDDMSSSDEMRTA
jgi:hypothetical protein